MMKQTNKTTESAILLLHEEYEETIASLKADISKFWVSMQIFTISPCHSYITYVPFTLMYK